MKQKENLAPLKILTADSFHQVDEPRLFRILGNGKFQPPAPEVLASVSPVRRLKTLFKLLQ